MGKTGEAQAALEQGADALRRLPGQAVEATQDLATTVRDEAVDLAEAAGDKVTDLRDTLADAIRDKPYQALGFAIGIGCLIGLVIARRHR
jgi:ElaB/YqjD/DUF883 family membrane-anchored ribosome-binding protein